MAIGYGASFEQVPLTRPWKCNGHRLQVESTSDRSRQHRDRVATLSDHEDVAAQVEKPRQFAPASLGFTRSRPRHGRQIAGHETDGQEREQRYPVLWVDNRERADWRQESKVEKEHRCHGDRNRDPQPRRCGDHEDNQQECRRNGRRIRHVQPLHIDECDGRDGTDARPQACRVR